jgi:hypothetical protein
MVPGPIRLARNQLRARSTRGIIIIVVIALALAVIAAITAALLVNLLHNFLVHECGPPAGC